MYENLETIVSYFEIWFFCGLPFWIMWRVMVATIICTIPLGNLRLKEVLFDNNSGNHMM